MRAKATKVSDKERNKYADSDDDKIESDQEREDGPQVPSPEILKSRSKTLKDMKRKSTLTMNEIVKIRKNGF